MSWLSQLWRNIKGGRTDAEVVFALVVDRLDIEQRNALWIKLTSVQKCVDIAMKHYTDPACEEAKKWVDGALAIVEGRR